jgi:hypothetical protein
MTTALSKGGLVAIAKAAGDDFKRRFREVIADPLNLLITRVPQAVTLRDGPHATVSSLPLTHPLRRYASTRSRCHASGFAMLSLLKCMHI